MSMNDMKRWRSAVLAGVAAAVAAVSLTVSGCTEEEPVEEPGVVEEEGNGGGGY